MNASTFLLLTVLLSLLFGSVLSGITFRFIVELAPKLEKAGLAGKDLNKGASTKIPEDGGLGPVSVFILVIALISFSPYCPSILLHAAFSIMASSFLGFVDDVVNLRWRYKLIVPAISLLPLINTYTGDGLQIGRIQLSPFLTRFYCLFFAIFSQNAVNIYAGINGLEVGQSIIACTFLLMVILRKLYLTIRTFSHSEDLSLKDIILYNSSLVAAIIILVCFLAVSHSLYLLNKYPSKVFVGDIYAYFAGSVFASACILSNTLIIGPLLFLLQIINFLISIPQLFGIVPCPRHRLPTFSSATGKLTGINTHLNLLNQYLRLRGPLHEKRLCRELLLIQIVISVAVISTSLFTHSHDQHVSTWTGGTHRKL